MAEHGLFLPSGEFRQVEIAPQANLLAEAASGRNKLKSMKAQHPSQAEMLVVFNDTQLLRQCDEESFGAFMKFVDRYKSKITHIVANGDITDYYMQSKFTHDVEKYAEDSADEIAGTRWVFETLSDMLPKAKKVMVDGNHDKRWDNMRLNAPGLGDWLKTPDEMFKLKELGWEHFGYGRGKYFRWHDMIFWHGARAGSKSNIPKLELDDAGVSGCSGHVNRNMYHETRNAFGDRKFWVTLGGFSKDNLEFTRSANTQWAQGFGVFFYTPETGVVPQLIPIKHGTPKFIYDGHMFDGTGFQIPTSGLKRDRFRGLRE